MKRAMGMMLAVFVWGLSICNGIAGTEPEAASLAALLDQVYPYSEYSFMGSVRMLELPMRDPETGRSFVTFDVLETLKGPSGIIRVEIRRDMETRPLGPAPKFHEMPAWQVDAEYYIECHDYDGWHWLESVWPDAEKERVMQTVCSLTAQDIEPSQQTRIRIEDLDQLYKQLQEEQQKGNLTRQEVREKMLERMKYYQDQEEPQVIWD